MRRGRMEADAATELACLSITAGRAMLLRIAESVRALTQANCAYVVRRAVQPSIVEVVAAVGSGAPAQHTRFELPDTPRQHELVLPLAVDGAPLGTMVVEGVTRPLAPQSQRELTLLSGMAALALQNHVLVIEAERRAAHEAQQQYRLLSGTIYHLKNTLAVASEYNELLELDGVVSDMQREYVARSRRSIATALRLLTELHELERTEAGELVPLPEPLNVVTLIRDILRDYRLATGTTGISFELDSGAVPSIRTDPDCVRQILDTLLSNAVRYSPAGAHVLVRVSLHNGRRTGDPAEWLRIDVCDQGPGVAEEDAVFEEVQRVERKGPPGFRLAIARRVARLLGGDLTLLTGADAGSTFSLWLPLQPD